MKRLIVVFLLFASSAAQTATIQEHDVCVGEYAITCKNRFPNRNIEFYGCGPTEKDAICYQYCGVPEEKDKCSLTRFDGPESGNKCGYSWVTARCYK
jgi:hypothetical protein